MFRQTSRMSSLVEMDMGMRGAFFRDVYGWPGWIIDVDLHVDRATGGWLAGAVRCTPPPGTRRNARRPTDDPELVTRLRHVAEGRHGVPGFVALGLPTPHKEKKDGVRLRAATIATMFETPRVQGFSPRRAISAVYGLHVVDEGNRTLYSPKLHRWIRQARTTKNPRTGEPYLLDDLDGNAPRRWPGSDGKHPLEPRRARPMLED
jgi:hypothetical protein